MDEMKIELDFHDPLLDSIPANKAFIKAISELNETQKSEEKERELFLKVSGNVPEGYHSNFFEVSIQSCPTGWKAKLVDVKAKEHFQCYAMDFNSLMSHVRDSLVKRIVVNQRSKD